MNNFDFDNSKAIPAWQNMEPYSLGDEDPAEAVKSADYVYMLCPNNKARLFSSRAFLRLFAFLIFANPNHNFIATFIYARINTLPDIIKAVS
jgi:hypothetical protein